MRLTQIGTVVLSDKSNNQTFDAAMRSPLIVLRNGAYDQDGSFVVLNNRKASSQFQLNNGEDADGQIDTLAKTLLAGRTVLKTVMLDGVRHRTTYAKATSFSAPVIPDTYDSYIVVSVSWSLEFPYWMDAAQIQFFDTGLLMDSGVNFDGHFDQFTFTTSPFTFSVSNGGSARGTLGALCIVPRAASSLQDFTLINLTNGLSFRYTGTVGASQRLDVDFLGKTINLDSTSVYGNFTIDDPNQVEWMALELLGNNFRISGVITGTIDLYYQHPDLFL